MWAAVMAPTLVLAMALVLAGDFWRGYQHASRHGLVMAPWRIAASGGMAPLGGARVRGRLP
jgi:hypothetical protein